LNVPDGLLLIDKPIGPTSHDVVQHIRRLLGVRRVGHTGTLDPPASGLLPILVGRATRLARFLPDEPKCYVGSLRLGMTSLTDDATAPPRTRFAGPLPPASIVVQRAATLEGQHLQTPPAISARHVGGRRLYRLNRTEPTVEGPARPVLVSRFAIRPSADEESFDFDAVVSAGTYVRSLVRDLGIGLGCGAILTALRRTAIGPLRIDEAIVPPDRSAPDGAAVLAARLVPLDQVPLTVTNYRIERPGDVRRFACGLAIDARDDDKPPGVRSVSADGKRVGIGELDGGVLRPLVVLIPPDAGADPAD
jgi:tRNA pseudouridine55 synthase